ncbi:hypothetical protein BH10PSE1_BH10PSE1_06850 [soil metagenome]
MRAGAAIGAVLCAALLLGSCTPASRARFHNETGQDVEITLSGQATIVRDKAWSRPFILAVGPQSFWNRDVRASGCRYGFPEPDVIRTFGVQRATLSADSIVLSIKPDFSLDVFTQAQFDRGALREPSLSVTSAKTCD